jgi:hypothetical protein
LRDDHFTRAGGALLPNDDKIAVGNLGFNHRIAPDFHDKQVLLAEQIANVDPLRLFKRQRRGTGCHHAYQRQPHLLLQQFGRQFNRPGHRAIVLPHPREQPFLLQRPQMAHHAIGGTDFEVLPNFPHGGAIAPRENPIADEFQHALLAFGNAGDGCHAMGPLGLGMGTWDDSNIRMFNFNSICTDIFGRGIGAKKAEQAKFPGFRQITDAKQPPQLAKSLQYDILKIVTGSVFRVV